MNNMGPRTEPWGTPVIRSAEEDLRPLHWKENDRLDKYDDVYMVLGDKYKKQGDKCNVQGARCKVLNARC